MTPFKTVHLALIAVVMILAGCSSDDIVNPTTAVTPDTAPPAIPTGLSAASGSAVVKLTWDVNSFDGDLQGFLVYRLAFGRAFQLTAQPIEMNIYIDAQPLGMPCGYAVSAVDEAGNESGWQEVRYDPVVELPSLVSAR